MAKYPLTVLYHKNPCFRRWDLAAPCPCAFSRVPGIKDKTQNTILETEKGSWGYSCVCPLFISCFIRSPLTLLNSSLSLHDILYTYVYIFWNIERIVSLVSEASSRVVRYTYMSSKPSGNLFVLHNKINQQCV